MSLGARRPLNKWSFGKDHWFSSDLSSTISGAFTVSFRGRVYFIYDINPSSLSINHSNQGLTIAKSSILNLNMQTSQKSWHPLEVPASAWRHPLPLVLGHGRTLHLEGAMRPFSPSGHLKSHTTWAMTKIPSLGGGFRYFLCSSLFGEDSHFG